MNRRMSTRLPVIGMLVLGFVLLPMVQKELSAQKKIWCCKGGKVSLVTHAQCKDMGGKGFETKEEAETYCKNNRMVWCCNNGKYFKTTYADCKKNGGKPFKKKEKAVLCANPVQSNLVWCCVNGVVKKVKPIQCKQKGGKPFKTKEAAEKFCQTQQLAWVPIGKKPTLFPRVRKSRKKFVSKYKPISLATLKKVLGSRGGVFKSIGNPGHPPVPASDDCSCTVHMWITPEKTDNVYYDDETFTVHYSVDCATGVTVGDTEFISTARLLRAAEDGTILGGGSGGTHYSDAAASGRLQGSYTISPGATPGVYRWTIAANNSLNPSGSSCHETLVYQILERPTFDDSCADYEACLYEMVRELKELVRDYITNNSRLDTEVEAFRDGIYQRRVIGLRLERELEAMARRGTTIVCQHCAGEDGIHWDESTPSIVYLDFCPPTYPTEYAILHELTHKVGFNTDLIRAYIDAGIWDAGGDMSTYRRNVEIMTCVVSGAPWEERGMVPRICPDYDY